MYLQDEKKNRSDNTLHELALHILIAPGILYQELETRDKTMRFKNRSTQLEIQERPKEFEK